MNKKRMIVSLITGAILGVFCVIGANVRFGGEMSTHLVFALWYNRIIMGLVIGLTISKKDLPVIIIRGAFLGLVVSFAYYATTGFSDIVSFLAGVVYGIIIEYVNFRVNK